MSDATVSPQESPDPLKAVADAMEAAVHAAQQGVSDARATASEAMPAASQALSNLVYKACYGLSYGVVFPTMLLARSVPQDNPIVHGLIDGGRAAIDMVNEMKGTPAVGSSASSHQATILGPSGDPLT